MTRPSRLVVLALTALVLAGCRDGEGERVRRTVEDFNAALVRGDGLAACDQLAEAGVSELLLTALEAGLRPPDIDAPAVDRCAAIAGQLAADASGRSELRHLPINRTLLEGDRATVETDAGAYELEEVRGHWRLTRFEPAAAVLAGRPVPVLPVTLTVGRPELPEPALGKALAGRTRKETVELTATFAPPDARVEVDAAPGTRVKSLQARDGRLKAELELRRGRNEVLLSASAPGRADTELAVRLTRE